MDPPLINRVPVEPLDDDRLARIERTLVLRAAELPAPPLRARWRPGALIAGAVACAAAAAVAWQLRGAIGDGGAAGEPAPIAIATHGDHHSVDIGDAAIDVASETAFTVTRPGDGVLIALAHGRIELAVGKRHERPPLVVRAGDTDVIVVGTHFSVDAGDGHGEVDVRVTEGVVRVVRRGAVARVAAGQEWQSAVGTVAMAAAPSAVATAATIAPTTVGTGDLKVAVGRPPEILHGRTAAVPVAPTAGTTATTTTTAGSGAHGSSPARPTEDGTAPRSDPMLELIAAIRAQPIAPAVDVGITDAEQRIARYQADDHDHDKASAALYSTAVVQRRCARCGGEDAAHQTLELYLRRFQSAPERPAALWLRVRLECDRAITADCRQAAASYLRGVPDGDAAEVALRITHAD